MNEKRGLVGLIEVFDQTRVYTRREAQCGVFPRCSSTQTATKDAVLLIFYNKYVLKMSKSQSTRSQSDVDVLINPNVEMKLICIVEL